MGADNWTTCPKCQQDFAAKKNAALEKAALAYGKAPPEEWHAMNREAQAIPDEPDTMFREDYEIGVHGGRFYVSYSGACQTCGFSHRFQHKEALKF